MRSNDAAAEALQELADLIAISGGDPYRVRSYEKAARSVAGYPLDLDTLDRKGLMAIPAIGAHTADKLLEFRQTGRITALEELHAQLPAGLRGSPGDPRTRTQAGPPGLCGAGHFVDAGTTQRIARRTAAQPDRLGRDQRTQPGARDPPDAGSRGRMPLALALDIAEDLVARLAALPQVSRVDHAGSLRRMRVVPAKVWGAALHYFT